MILTDYFHMKKLPNCQSKLRRDCVASTLGYPPFEQRAARSRDNRFKFYLTSTPGSFKADARRKSDLAITDTSNISSIFIPDLDNPNLGFGDVKGTNDAILFVFSEDYTEVELFIARGMKHHVRGLFARLVDGDLDDEIAVLRERAQPTNADSL